MSESLDKFFQRLWTQYIQTNKTSLEIKKLIEDHEKKEIINDHIALRTIKDKKIGIKALSIQLKSLGYNKINDYTFSSKKLQAIHLETKNPKDPKIFLSELEIEKLSPFAQSIGKEIIKKSPVASLNIFTTGSTWERNYFTYKKLYQESEYLAWFYCFGFMANHFTVSLSNLEKLGTLEKINNFVKEKGYQLNTAGGEIKGTPQDYLEQSSTMAQEIPINFKDGTFNIPSCFYEFARRYEKDGKLFQGFIPESADKIFESTNHAS